VLTADRTAQVAKAGPADKVSARGGGGKPRRGTGARAATTGNPVPGGGELPWSPAGAAAAAVNTNGGGSAATKIGVGGGGAGAGEAPSEVSAPAVAGESG